MSTITRIVAVAFIASSIAEGQRAPVKLPSKPDVPSPKPFVFPTFTVDSLPNGLQFAVVENHELPLVSVKTAVRGVGTSGLWFLDTPEKAGAWGLMLMTLREGTTTRTSTQILDELLDLGTEMRFPAAGSFIPPQFRAARSTWIPSLEVMADVMINPIFPEATVSRVKTQLSTALDRLPPVSIGNRLAFSHVYGGEGPYANLFATSATLASVTRDDLVALQQKYLRPQNTIVVVSGDVTVPEVRSAMMRTFGSWTRGGTTVKAFSPGVRSSAPTTIYLKDSPGLAQSIVVGAIAVPGRQHADAAAAEAMASLVGGFSVSGGSRLYSAFRIERGLSYSPTVQLFLDSELAPLVATATVAPAVTDTAVMTMLKVFRDLRQDRPVTAGELDFAQRNLVGKLPTTMEQVDSVGGTVLASIRDGLPASYLNDWVKRMSGLTLGDVQAATAKYLDTDHLPIIVVADRSKVESALRATGIPVVIVP